MKIAIYTSTQRTVFNDYNIAELISNFPHYEYLFLSVKKNKSILNVLKRKAYEAYNGVNYLNKDWSLLTTSIKNLTKKYDTKNVTYREVDSVNDTDSEAILKQFSPDIILQAGAGILKSNIFSIANIATINVHHGLSPYIRGMNSTFWCMYYGLDKIGVTCHVIDKGIDTGPILFQYQYSLKAFDTFVEIQLLLAIQGGNVLIRSVDFLSKNSTFNIAKEEVDSYYFGKIDYKDFNCLKKNNYNPLKSSDGLIIKKYYKKEVIKNV